jgi:hypothetical protein
MSNSLTCIDSSTLLLLICCNKFGTSHSPHACNLRAVFSPTLPTRSLPYSDRQCSVRGGEYRDPECCEISWIFVASPPSGTKCSQHPLLKYFRCMFYPYFRRQNTKSKSKATHRPLLYYPETFFYASGTHFC